MHFWIVEKWEKLPFSTSKNEKQALVCCQNCKNCSQKAAGGRKKKFFNLFFSLAFFSNFQKPNQWWIDYYHESNFNHLSDAPGAFNISMRDIDMQSCGAPLEWNLLFISMIGKSSQNSFFKFSIYMIGEKNKLRLRRLFCWIA